MNIAAALGLALSLTASAALAAQPVTVTDPDNANAAKVDSSGNLQVNCTTGCGGGGSNPAAGPTGSAVPADASYTGLINGSGNLVGMIQNADLGAEVHVMNPSGLAVAPAQSSAAESCHVFKASAGTLYGASGYIGAAGFIYIQNAASAPANGAIVPYEAPIYVPTAGTWAVSFQNPATMSTGITICASSTGPLTLTLYSTNTTFSAQVQ